MAQQSLDDVVKVIELVDKLAALLKNMFSGCASLPKEPEDKK